MRPPSDGAQDVRLRESRPVARFRHRAEREPRGIGLDGEMRHRFEHRDLDQRALAGAGAVEQRAEHAVRGIDAGDRVRQRGAEETRAIRIDDHAEEAAERLRHRVVAGTVDVGAVAAESADGAIDEARIDLGEALRARAEAVRGAGPEILDVDVGLREQLVEDRAIGRRLQIQREAALVAVVGLEMRGIAARPDRRGKDRRRGSRP